MRQYILDGKNPVLCEDIHTWAKWYETADRIVAKTELNRIRVSTVFLALDHAFYGTVPPILFETMIFGGEYDEETWRHSTWEEAVKGHEEAVKLVTQSFTLTPPNV